LKKKYIEVAVHIGKEMGLISAALISKENIFRSAIREACYWNGAFNRKIVSTSTY
jgi:hypothetical protein